MQAMLNRLFAILDPEMFEIWQDIPSVVLTLYFMSLFVDMKRKSIGLALFDLILLLGSNCMTSTVYCPETVPVNPDRPFCRTVQLMLSIGLAMIRQMILKVKIEQRKTKEPLQKLSCN